MIQKLILLTALTLNAAAVCAEPPTLADALADHRYTLRLDDGRLTGDGAAFLNTATRNARYVLVGEEHDLADTSRLTEALFRELLPGLRRVLRAPSLLSRASHPAARSGARGGAPGRPGIGAGRSPLPGAPRQAALLGAAGASSWGSVSCSWRGWRS